MDNPNVGKGAIFSRFTGFRVIISKIVGLYCAPFVLLVGIKIISGIE